jgi:hypothetical protein
MDGCHRRLPAGRCELQAHADERRLEVIWEKILQQHAEEDSEHYLADLEGQCEVGGAQIEIEANRRRWP